MHSHRLRPDELGEDIGPAADGVALEVAELLDGLMRDDGVAGVADLVDCRPVGLLGGQLEGLRVDRLEAGGEVVQELLVVLRDGVVAPSRQAVDDVIGGDDATVDGIDVVELDTGLERPDVRQVVRLFVVVRHLEHHVLSRRVDVEQEAVELAGAPVVRNAFLLVEVARVGVEAVDEGAAGLRRPLLG